MTLLQSVANWLASGGGLPCVVAFVAVCAILAFLWLLWDVAANGKAPREAAVVLIGLQGLALAAAWFELARENWRGNNTPPPTDAPQ